jgi:glycosyltransferase involved in cell wall biosynthesis
VPPRRLLVPTTSSTSNPTAPAGARFKVAQVHWGSQYLLGGVERVAQDMARVLTALGAEVTTIGIAHPSLADFRRPVAGTPRFLPWWRIHQERNKAVKERLFACAAVPLALSSTTVIAHGIQALPIARFRPTVMIDHGPFRPYRAGYEEVREQAMAKAKAVVVATRAGREALTRRFPAFAEKIRTIPFSTPARPDTGAGGSATHRVLSVGRLNEARKGMVELLGVFRRVVDAIADAQLTLAGAGDPTALNARAAELGIGEKVRVVSQDVVENWDGELDRLYGEADIFALHTAYETFGVVFLEAMAYGLPIVSTRPADLPAGDVIEEVVVESRAGIATELGDAQAMADALIALMRDHDLRAELSRRGRASVGAQYSELTVGRQYLELLTSIGSRGV